MFIDLHTHTKASDGTFTPEEIVLRAKLNNIKVVAITDHDTMGSIEEAIKYGEIHDIDVIPGIEFSTRYENTEIHIVGLFLDYTNKKLLDRLTTIQQDRITRNDRMIKKLNELGYNITLDEAKELAGDKILTRAHFAKLLVIKGYYSSMEDVFKKVLGAGCPGYIKRQTLSPVEAIKLIKDASGISIMAHPLLYGLSEDVLEELISFLKSKGLDGIEAYYYSFNDEDTKYIEKLALKHDLLLSGGSDFHGDIRKGVDIGIGRGNLKIDINILNLMKARLEGNR